MNLNNHMLIMVGCHYNAFQYTCIKILCIIWQCQWQNTNQTLNPQKTVRHRQVMGCLLWGWGRKLTTLQRHHTVWCSGEGIQFTTIIEVTFCSDKCSTFIITSDILQTQFSNVFFIYTCNSIKISQKFVLYNACIYMFPQTDSAHEGWTMISLHVMSVPPRSYNLPKNDLPRFLDGFLILNWNLASQRIPAIHSKHNSKK